MTTPSLAPTTAGNASPSGSSCSSWWGKRLRGRSAGARIIPSNHLAPRVSAVRRRRPVPLNSHRADQRCAPSLSWVHQIPDRAVGLVRQHLLRRPEDGWEVRLERDETPCRNERGALLLRRQAQSDGLFGELDDLCLLTVRADPSRRGASSGSPMRSAIEVGVGPALPAAARAAKYSLPVRPDPRLGFPGILGAFEESYFTCLPSPQTFEEAPVHPHRLAQPRSGFSNPNVCHPGESAAATQ